ncbi:hypothetical protein [Longimicrobium sp.]|uniref:hypothetical protein n=1 Tax=Longimicrobium sp. TaxID=2029185 RepID=UPI002CC51DA6|nr:hypothetical protein [Longimicrobium sp.]HSU16132.1 hypothetical protein [Longimicrobium sp.]
MRQWLRDPEKWLQLMTLVGALVAFAIGLHEYRQEQRWKRLEYFTQLLQAEEAEPEVRSALAMLEYNQPRVCVHDDAADAPRCFVATDTLLVSALDGAMRNRVLTADEYQVVYALDRLLTGLDRLEYLQHQGFVDEEVRHPTAAYWIALIGDRRSAAKPAGVRAKLCEYVRFFEYAGALRLIAHYTPPRDRVPQCTASAGS